MNPWRWIGVFLLAALAAAGCSRQPAPAKGRTVRIVSFSPAITRILFDMGLGEQVVGVTRFCRLPAGVDRPRVGDAMTINAETILAVKPDVIFAQSRPSKFQGVRDVRPDVQIVELTLEELPDVVAAIERIGRVVGRGDLAAQRAAAFAAAIQAVRQQVADRKRPRVLFVMGTDRPTAAGPGTFLADLIVVAGGVNAGQDIPGQARWRPTQIEAIIKAAPDVLICQASDPERGEKVRQYWLKWQDIPAAKARRVHVVTDPGWTIPSTQLAELAGRLARRVHPPEGSVAAETQPASGAASQPASGPAPGGTPR